MSRVAMSYEVTTTSWSCAAAVSSAPVRRSVPWWRWTRSDGAKRAISAHPLLDDAHRADDERRAEGVPPEVLALGRDHRDRLHRLAEAHVVGEDRADPEVAEHPQPAVAALLERKELELHRGGRRTRAEARCSPPSSSVGERRVERDLAELEPRLVGLEPRDGADEIDDPGARAAALEEAQRPLDVRAAERMPLAGDPDERLLRCGELGELVVGERRRRRPRAASRTAASSVGERSPLERRAGWLVAVRLTLDPGWRDATQAAGSSTGTPRSSSSGIASRRKRRTVSGVELPPRPARRRRTRCPRSASSGVHLGRAGGSGPGAGRRRAGRRRRRRRRSTSSDAGRPSVGSSSACSHSSSDERRRSSPLVEVQAEPPRRRRAPRRARRRPSPAASARAPSSRRARGSTGSARGEPFEEVVERGRANLLHGLAEPHARRRAGGPSRSGRRARDTGRATVASRSPSNASAQTAGSAAAISVSVACTLSSSVAPQNACHQPPPWSRSRMDEALGDRALRQLDEREDRVRAAACRRLGRRSVCQANQLRDVEPSGRKAVAAQRELRDGGLPERELARRQRAVGVANEEDRRRILLPDDLQRRVHGGAVFGHQPFKVAASVDIGVPRTGLACCSALWLTPPDSISDLRRKKEIEMARARRQAEADPQLQPVARA